MLTLRLKELQLSVEKLQMWFREDNLGEIIVTRATTNITRVRGIVLGLKVLSVGGVGIRHLCRHLRNVTWVELNLMKEIKSIERQRVEILASLYVYG